MKFNVIIIAMIIIMGLMIPVVGHNTTHNYKSENNESSCNVSNDL